MIKTILINSILTGTHRGNSLTFSPYRAYAAIHCKSVVGKTGREGTLRKTLHKVKKKDEKVIHCVGRRVAVTSGCVYVVQLRLDKSRPSFRLE